MNALTLLKQDHGNVEELFRRFEMATAADVDELARVRDLVIDHLSRHAVVEEQFFYPGLRAKIGEEESFGVLEGLEEHHVVKATLAELERMAPSHERFRAKFTVTMESVRHHIEEEETELFAQARDSFSVEELNTMGEHMETAKSVAPSRPHPLVPDTPPFNLILGVPMAVLDGAITAGKEAVGRLVHSGTNGRGGRS